MLVEDGQCAAPRGHERSVPMGSDMVNIGISSGKELIFVPNPTYLGRSANTATLSCWMRKKNTIALDQMYISTTNKRKRPSMSQWDLTRLTDPAQPSPVRLASAGVQVVSPASDR